MSLRKRGILEETYRPCQHLLDYKSKYGARGFRMLQRCIRTRSLGSASLKTEGKEVPRCAACRRNDGRLYACLLCATIGCWVPPGILHARAHAQAKPGHDLAIDIERAELFCCSCRDQVYDPDFDRAVVCAQSAAQRANAKHHGSCKRTDRGAILDSEFNRPELRKKRTKAEYRPWVPTSREHRVLTRRSTPLHDDSGFPRGLRGLNNLGNTCFMNSVLQALLHAPPLRNYFLSDRHNRNVCQRPGRHLCLSCDTDIVFAAAFSGKRSPYNPAQFLHSWWQHAAKFAGYAQQDAHEFFISVVDGIHSNVGNPGLPGMTTRSAGDGDCECIAHRVFSGLLRSDVTCTVCGFSSTTYDPCIDISLDLEPAAGSNKVYPDSLKSGKVGRSSRGTPAASFGTGTSTLYGCLDRFTRPERLDSNEKFFCENCQLPQESVKQMSLRKLPLVLSFHIKRFEHSPGRNMSRKIDRYVQFPYSLDMSPYLSSAIVRMRHGHRLLSDGGDEVDSLSLSSPPEFELFAVVTHSGKLDSGHYITYLRLGGHWYKCDDAWVTQVHDDVVRASQGYMLYYVQKTFSYKASEQWSGKNGFPSRGGSGNHK